MPSKHSAYGRGSRPKVCRECGALAVDGVTISARGLCRDCAIARFTIPADQLVAKSGPAYDQWVDSMIEWAGRLARSR